MRDFVMLGLFHKKKLKPGLVAIYDIRPGNGVGQFSKEKISKEKMKNKG